MLIFKKNVKKNICLMGLMGSGKTVIGKNIGQFYKLDFYDTDNEIQNNIGININLIFLKYGEKYFRELEENICLKLLEKKGCIISLGGGSICNSKIRKAIKENSHSIYLKVSIDSLALRLANSRKRPLLKNVDKKQKLQELFNNRKIFYNKADLIVDNNFDKKEVISEITSKIKVK